MNLRDSLLGKPKVKPVEITGYGTVYFRNLSFSEMGHLGAEKTIDSALLQIIYMACDAEANNLFTEDDLPVLRNMSIGLINDLVEGGMKAWSKKKEEAKEEDLVPNS